MSIQSRISGTAVLLPMLVAALETTWLWLWLQWMVVRFYPTQPALGLPILWLWGLILASAALARWLLTTQSNLNSVRIVLVGGGALAIALSSWLSFGNGQPFFDREWVGVFMFNLRNWGEYVSPSLIPPILAAYCWGQGLLLGRGEQIPAHLRRSFFIGLMAIIVLLIFIGQTALLPANHLFVGLIVFFGLGLGGLALASAEHGRQVGQLATGNRLPINRYWLTSVAVGVGVVLGTGLLITLVLNPSLVDQTLGIIPAILLLIGILIMQPVSMVIGWLLDSPWVQQLMSGLFGDMFRDPPVIGEVPLPAESDLEIIPLPEILDLPISGPVLEYFIGSIAAVILLALLWLALRRLSVIIPVATGNETRETIASRDLLAQQLRGVLRNLFGRGGRQSAYLSVDPRSKDARLVVRLAYQRLLAWANAQGHPRVPYFTPQRYAEHLSGHFPDQKADFAALTAVYLKARYSTIPPTADEAARAQKITANLPKRLK